MFDLLSSGTDIDKYINFYIEFVTSLPVIDLLVLDWRQETRSKSIEEVMETREANQSEKEPEIVADEDENRKITPAEACRSLMK